MGKAKKPETVKKTLARIERDIEVKERQEARGIQAAKDLIDLREAHRYNMGLLQRMTPLTVETTVQVPETA